jgi:DNA (cytosine-5)-methyltransferase 3A
MKVLSLFDGMACGMLAMRSAGVDVTEYDAYEIDKYAIQVAKHNFPGIREHGDVFMADFTRYKGVDFVVGGSPCTYWSIAQTKNRETEAHGIGWELFRQYVRAIREAEPRFFVYENNKSMSDAIRKEISETFGFEPICINSALVSAQNRQRLYWVGVRQEDGTYRKADIDQPDDRGILLKDILESGENLTGGEKSFCLTTRCQGAIPDNTIERGQHTMVAEPVGGRIVGRRINEDGHRDDYNEDIELVQRFEVNKDPQKTNCLTTVQKDNMVAEPIRVGSLPRPNGDLSTSQAMRVYSDDGKSVCVDSSPQKHYMVPAEGAVGNMYGKGQNGQLFGVNSKTKTLSAGTGQSGNGIGSNNSPKAVLPYPDYNGEPIYEVKDSMITIKGKQYPIKLADGHYVIRKLTVDECKRLQTVPDDYDMTCISNTQAYKCLGNGWTIEVIAHLIRGALKSAGSRTPRTLDDWAEVCA